MIRNAVIPLLLALLAFLMFVGRFVVEMIVADVGAEDAVPVFRAALVVIGACMLIGAGVAVLWGPPARRFIIAGDDSPLDDSPRARQRSRLARAGMMSMLAIATVGLLGCSSGCAALKNEGRAVAHDAVNCTTKTAKARIAQYGGVVDAALELATGADGKVDKAKLAKSAEGFLLDDGMCVLAELVARHTAAAAAPADPNAPQASGLEADPGELQRTFRELAGGRTYLTSYGPL